MNIVIHLFILFIIILYLFIILNISYNFFCRLKRCRILPEREARTVLMQIISGLRYLNTPGDCTGGNGTLGEEGESEPSAGTSRRKAIIHYDLKPGEI